MHSARLKDAATGYGVHFRCSQSSAIVFFRSSPVSTFRCQALLFTYDYSVSTGFNSRE